MQEIKEITVAELKALYHSGQYDVEISTPDGFQKITAWFDKGLMPTTRVATENGLVTVCADNHLLQTSDRDTDWIPAAEVQPNVTSLLTQLGISKVIASTPAGPQQCYDFTVDHPNHRYWGDGFSSHNSGKSYICSANVIKNAQAQGIFPVLIDTENALDEAWLQRLGVDTSEEKLLKINMAMIDDVAKTISLFMKDYRELPESDRPRVIFVIDSLGMLLTPTDVNQFEAGDLKGDMGRKPKALAALVRNCVNMFGSYNVGLVATNHTYASQDIFNPDPVISGGNGFIFASSIVVAMRKLKLKEDGDGNKTTDVRGIRAACKIMKSRYTKPFEDIEVKIPWDTGMDPYSGVFDYFERKTLVNKEGNRFVYRDLSGREHKYFRKEFLANTNGILDLMMEEFAEQIKPIETLEILKGEAEDAN